MPTVYDEAIKCYVYVPSSYRPGQRVKVKHWAYAVQPGTLVRPTGYRDTWVVKMDSGSVGEMSEEWFDHLIQNQVLIEDVT